MRIGGGRSPFRSRISAAGSILDLSCVLVVVQFGTFRNPDGPSLPGPYVHRAIPSALYERGTVELAHLETCEVFHV